MALLERFEKRPIEPARVHGGVTCGYAWGEVGNRRILQMQTYGSSERQVPGKPSQHLQLDESAARELLRVIREAFPTL